MSFGARLFFDLAGVVFSTTGPCDREPHGGHIVGQRCRRILYDADVVTPVFAATPVADRSLLAGQFAGQSKLE